MLVDCWLTGAGRNDKKADYVELGLTCAGVCEALSRGTGERRADQLSQSVLEVIEKLTT